ncbi:MAG: ABC transporter permease [Thaumarchaeota archaeon]|nr:MAG: ABC transporter permease [Nitrososphaerota archaeon]
MNLPQYVLRRLFFAVIVVLSVITITFVLSHYVGSDVIVAWLGKSAALHPQLAQLYAAKYHLNEPIWVQYYYYIVGLLQGNFGYSPSRGFLPVLAVIGQTLPLTLQLVFFAFVISLGLGVLLGALSARYGHTYVDGGIRAFYLAGYSSPPFFVALVLLIVFASILQLLPSGTAVDSSLAQPSLISGIPILDSLLEGKWAYFASAVEHAILPSLALALVTFGVITRILRSSLMEVLQMNYIRTARAKGLDENAVFYRHALRNAFIPVVTLSSIILTWLITGTIFVENVFAYPGLGQYVVTALLGQDYPGILAATIVFAVTIAVGNLVADLLYAVVDPQIRLG